jgi:hypothetical protein
MALILIRRTGDKTYNRYGHSGTLDDPLPALGKCRFCGKQTRDKIGSVYECLDCDFDYDDY